MKNKLAIIICLLAALTIAATSERSKRSLEDRIADLEAKQAEQSVQLEQLNWMMYQDDQGCINLRGPVAVLGDYVIVKKLYAHGVYQY